MPTRAPRDEPRARPILCLWGFMGAGKTTIGRALARTLGLPFDDLDECIEAATGLRVHEAFVAHGEADFRSMEAIELRRLLSFSGPRVVSLGGGTLLDDALREEALRRSFVIVLHASRETLFARVRGTNRPLLGDDPEAAIHELSRDRAAAYGEAHAQVSTDGLSIDLVVEAVKESWVGQRS